MEGQLQSCPKRYRTNRHRQPNCASRNGGAASKLPEARGCSDHLSSRDCPPQWRGSFKAARRSNERYPPAGWGVHAAMEGQLQSCPKASFSASEPTRSPAAMEGQLQSCPKPAKPSSRAAGRKLIEPQWRGSFKAARSTHRDDRLRPPNGRRNGGAASKLPEGRCVVTSGEYQDVTPQWRGSFKAARRSTPGNPDPSGTSRPQWRGSFKAARRGPLTITSDRPGLPAAMEGQLQSCPKYGSWWAHVAPIAGRNGGAASKLPEASGPGACGHPDGSVAAMEGQLQSCPKQRASKPRYMRRLGPQWRGSFKAARRLPVQRGPALPCLAAMEGQLQSCPKVSICQKHHSAKAVPQWRGSFKAARRHQHDLLRQRVGDRRNGGAASKLPEAFRQNPTRIRDTPCRNGGAASKLPEGHLPRRYQEPVPVAAMEGQLQSCPKSMRAAPGRPKRTSRNGGAASKLPEGRIRGL